MSTSLYDVTVSEIPNPTTVVLSMQVIYSSMLGIESEPSFALMLLQESCERTGALAQEVDFDSLMNADWNKQYCMGYIKKVKLFEVKNKPPAAARRDYTEQHSYFKDPKKWVNGKLRIEVTHPAWIEHLTIGKTWDTTAFELDGVRGRYEACEPIAPAKPVEAPTTYTLDYSKGFHPIYPHFFSSLFPKQTEIVMLPSYGHKAYQAVDKIEGAAVSEEALAAWVGKPILFENGFGQEHGVLVSGNTVVQIQNGSYGSCGLGSSAEWVGLALFDTQKKRQKELLNYSNVLRYGNALPLVKEVIVSGKSAVLKVWNFNHGEDLILGSKVQAAKVLMAAIGDDMDVFEANNSKFAQWMRREIENRDLHYYSVDDLYPLVADGLISAFDIEKTISVDQPKLDEMTHGDRLHAFEAEAWEEWTVKIEVSDAAWLAHLVEGVPFHWNFSKGEDAEATPWTAEPIVWVEA